MKMSKYGYSATIEIKPGMIRDDEMQVFVAKETMADCSCYTELWVPVSAVNRERLSVTVVDRDADDEHTDILLPDRETIITVNDALVKLKYFDTFFKWISGKKIKMSEVEN